ncbi:MAG: hypothetical protein M5U12_35445 [Verrucomicrobia bacterium]|nr:hypothetical protein [Verrucomicrobiota bacterium]
MQPRTLPRRRAGRIPVPGPRAWAAALLLSTLGAAAHAAEADSTDPPEPARPPAPILTLASRRDLGSRVAGQLDAQPETPYQILLWTVTGCGDDQLPVDFQPLAEIDAPTDAAGHAAFQLVLPIPLNDTQQIVARTRDATGATSDLSDCRPVQVEMTYWEDAALTLAGPTNTVVAGNALPLHHHARQPQRRPRRTPLPDGSRGRTRPPRPRRLRQRLSRSHCRGRPRPVLRLDPAPDGTEPLRVTLRPASGWPADPHRAGERSRPLPGKQRRVGNRGRRRTSHRPR